MSDLLGISGNAVMAYQRALGTVSNNIANVATDGYSRQDVTFVSGAPRQLGSASIGTGVIFDRVQRQYDAFAESNLRNSNSDLASQEPMVNYANRVIDVMGGPAVGLNSALDQFFGSARNLSADPASSVLRGSFVRDAENLATRFGQLSSQLDLVQSETDQLVVGNVNEMNTIVKQLAEINIQMTKQKSASMQPADLLDQRDVLLKELSSYAHINTGFAENGAVTVSLGPSLTRDVAVDGVKFFMLGTNFNSAAPEKVSLVLDPYGNATTLTGLTGGRLSGIMSFREQVLGSSRSSLDTLANNLVKQVNTVHSSGIDAYGNTGGNLFSIDKSTVGSAGTVKVAIKDALKVSAAAQFRIIESPNNTSSADASIQFIGTPTNGPAPISSIISNNSNAAAAITVTAKSSTPMAAVATIQNGLTDIGIFMSEADPGQQLQIFTRDGRQLAGKAVDAATQSLILTEE